ncbi:hypothetical protein [Deinococcus multiflagellatus]|nr:hypothetical protein [Deinococcus multiflagellatus]MBZ9712945.1 hypothetical protein [Deinococcus multiflagellatus]
MSKISTSAFPPLSVLRCSGRPQAMLVGASLCLLSGLALTACGGHNAQTLTVKVQNRFPDRQFCEPESFEVAVADAALTKALDLGCWRYDRQDFTFLSEKDTDALYTFLGGKVEKASELNSASGFTLPIYKRSFPTFSATRLPALREAGEAFYYLGETVRDLLHDPQAVPAASTLTGAGPITLQTGQKRVVFEGTGDALVRDVYSAPVATMFRRLGPQTISHENVQGGAQHPARHRIQTGLPEHSVVALVIRLEDLQILGHFDPHYFYEVAEVQKDGRASFSANLSKEAVVSGRHLLLVPRLKLQPSLTALRAAATARPKEADAVILQISGVPFREVGQKALNPSSPTSVAR